MSLIPYEKFTRLRLRQFEPSASNEEESACFEFMDSLWHEESIRGAEFLRHERDPNRLGGICLDFRYMSPALPTSILAAIQLPLRPGMSVEDVVSLLGDPADTEDGGPGCVVHDFKCGAEDRYHVRCYFTDGLHGVDIMRFDLLQEHDHDT